MATPVEANVVLTADVDQYNRGINLAADNTATLGDAVDSLGQKLDRLSKSAGRSMFKVAAADVAGITAATAAYAAFERQMTSLNVQSAVLYRTTEAQNRAFSSYSRTVNGLRSDFGVTTSSAAALVETLARVSDKTASIDNLAQSYAKLGAATGESSAALAASMTQLQRTMGTPQRDTDKLNNQLLILSKNSNASAEGILQFANSIAPVGRLVGVSQRDITSFSGAFIKAGQDGYRAANTFNKLMGDIAYATQSGSPELRKYANLVGMTAEQFGRLGGTDKFLKIFDSINQQGPKAITTLNQMGLDGAQTVRTITAMAQQSGGLSAALKSGQGDPNALQRGSEAALQGIVDQLGKLRSEAAMTGEAIGSKFAGPTKLFIGGIEGMAGALHSLADSPLGTITAWVTGTTAAVALLGGALFTAAKGLMLFAGGNMLLRNSFTSGIWEAARMGPQTRQGLLASDGFNARVGGGFSANQFGAAPVGMRISEKGNAFSRSLYSRGADIGARLPAIIAPGGGGGPGLLSRVAGYGMAGTGWVTRNLVGAQYSAGAAQIGMPGTGGLTQYDNRWRLTTSPTYGGLANTAMGYFRGGAVGAYNALYGDSVKLAAQESDAGVRKLAAPAVRGDFASFVASQRAVEQSGAKLAKAFDATNTGAMNASRGFGRFASAMGHLSVMLGATAVGAAKTFKDIGGSAMAGLGITPWMLGIGATAGGIYALDKMRDKNEYEEKNYQASIATYLEASGRQPISGTNTPWSLPSRQPRTMAQAKNISETDFAYAQNPDYELRNSRLKDLSPDKAVGYLTPQFEAIRGDRKAIGALATDLANAYSITDAQKIMNSLFTGGQNPYSPFLDQAADPGGRGPLGILGVDSGNIEDAYNSVSQQINEQSSYMQSVYGGKSYSQMKLRGLGETLFGYVGRGGSSLINRSKDMQAPGLTKNDEFFQQFLSQNMGFGETFGEADLLKNREFTMQKNQKDMLRVFLEKNYFAKDVEGPEGVSRTEQEAFLRSYGVDPAKIEEGAAAAAEAVVERMTKEFTKKSNPNELNARLAAMKSGDITQTSAFQYAIDGGIGSANAQYKAVNEGFGMMANLSPSERLRRINDLMAENGTPGDPGYLLLAGMQARNMRDVGFRQPYMTRTQQFGSQIDLLKGEFSSRLGPEGQQRRETAVNAFQSNVMDQYNYFKQMLYQYREYDVMRDRAEYDFNLSREYAEEDYARTRAYSYQDFNISRERAEKHFRISQERSQYDFNLSRKRQEEDFMHQRELMVKQAAQSMYNIYQRTPVQQTSGADWLLYNTGDQLKDMNQQSRQLKQLRNMGVSNNVIQQMGLADPKNQQQLDRFLADIQDDPKLVKKFNQAIQKRLQAAEKLVTDESNVQWTEFNRQYRLARQRAQDDFERQAQRARKDFKMSMSESEADFKRMMERQQEQYAIVMDRQADAYNLTMQRSAEDLERSARTIDGNFEEMLTKGVKRLSGHAKAQARAVLEEFRDLKNSTTPVAINLMEQLAAIFGVSYKAPRRAGGGPGGGFQPGQNNGNPTGPQGGSHDDYAAGGVVPGWSPGFDNKTYRSAGGHSLNLAGGEAVMVPEWTRLHGGERGVKAMNDAARKGYFLGGVMPTKAAEVTRHPGYPFARWAGDLNDPGQGDYGDPVVAWKGGKVASVNYNGAGHQDPGGSYGRWIVVNHPSGENTWYAHLSQARVRAGQEVRPGQMLGNVGDFGKAFGAHLHFEIRGGNAPLGGSGGYGGGSGMSVASILQDSYPSVERVVAGMAGVHPLKNGQMSRIINRMARTAASRMRKKYGAPGTDGPLGPLDHGVDPGSGAVQMGRQMAANAGWSGPQWDALYQLWQHESNWNPYANNPISSAYGIPQALVDLHGIKPPYYGRKVSGSGASSQYAGGDPATQIRWGLNYIKGRYGNPANAWQHWQGAHSYGEGGIFANGMQNINVGERGPEAVFPLNDKGAEFIQQIISRTQVGTEGKIGTSQLKQPLAHNMYNTYKIDRSTNFTGPITVQAQDPNQFIHKLRQKQRTQALTQPQLAGSR